MLVLLSVDVDALLFSLRAIAALFSEAAVALPAALSDKLSETSKDFTVLKLALSDKDSLIFSDTFSLAFWLFATEVCVDADKLSNALKIFDHLISSEVLSDADTEILWDIFVLAAVLSLLYVLSALAILALSVALVCSEFRTLSESTVLLLSLIDSESATDWEILVLSSVLACSDSTMLSDTDRLAVLLASWDSFKLCDKLVEVSALLNAASSYS